MLKKPHFKIFVLIFFNVTKRAIRSHLVVSRESLKLKPISLIITKGGPNLSPLPCPYHTVFFLLDKMEQIHFLLN